MHDFFNEAKGSGANVTGIYFNQEVLVLINIWERGRKQAWSLLSGPSDAKIGRPKGQVTRHFIRVLILNMSSPGGTSYSDENFTRHLFLLYFE